MYQRARASGPFGVGRAGGGRGGRGRRLARRAEEAAAAPAARRHRLPSARPSVEGKHDSPCHYFA